MGARRRLRPHRRDHNQEDPVTEIHNFTVETTGGGPSTVASGRLPNPIQTFTVGTTAPPPSGDEMIAEMKRILAGLPRPVLLCHPADRDIIAAALLGLPFGIPAPEL